MAEDNVSLFGPSEAEARALLAQQVENAANARAARLGPQGNPFYVPSLSANSYQGGAVLGNAINGLFGRVPPEIKKARDMQAIQQQVDQMDVSGDPVNYAKAAASAMLKAGYRNEALQALQWAQNYQKNESTMQYQDALSNQANAVAKEKIELMDDKQRTMAADATLKEAKANLTKIDSDIAYLEQTRKTVKTEADIRLIDAQIDKLKSDREANLAKARGALHSGGGAESLDKMLARIYQEKVMKKEMTQEEAMQRIEWIKADPMRLFMGKSLGNPESPLMDAAKKTPGTTVVSPKDNFTVGKTYKDGKGNKAIYRGNGKWESVK